ncbi:MAG: ThuA domain-containing protein [Planctomycetota bacterium]|jgi:type 1 glutamine amidotransferase
MFNKKTLSTTFGLFLALSAGLFAVTAEEIEKMQSAMPSQPVVQPAQPRIMLVFSLCKGFKHDSIPYWEKALDVMSEKTGAFKVVHSKDMSVFTKESLKAYDVICFNNTTMLVPDTAQQQAILDFIKNGKGIVGIHAATDNFYEWPEGMEMMGGKFTGHPWTAGGTWAVKLDEPDHPLMKSFKGQNFTINDEIYRTDPPLYSRQKQRVLMSLDMTDPTTKNTKGVKPGDMDTGLSWIKRVGKGRLFYCSLGHNNHLTWNTAVLGHYLAGIQYAAGDYKVDDSLPTATSNNLSEIDE